MRSITLLTATITALTGMMAGPASASTISFLDVEHPSIGTGTLGTVTLTQNGANEVDVGVVLASTTAFLSQGNFHNHNSFAFNLDLINPFTVTLTNPLSGYNVVSSVANQPYGDFTTGLDCISCDSNTSKPGPLDFKVSDASGITIADFIANNKGYFFSADISGPSGGKGNIASDEKIASTPLPGSFPLFAAGVLGLGAIGWRKSRSSRIGS